MPLAKDVANELRMLADALDKEPETNLTKPMIFFSSYGEKQEFLNAARILPRPLKKRIGFEGTDYEDLVLERDTPALNIHSAVRRSVMCTLIKPAVPAIYDCEPLLSELEQQEVSRLSA